MLFEGLLGGVAARAALQIIGDATKYFRDKQDHKFELAKLEINYKIEERRNASDLAKTEMTTDTQLQLARIEAQVAMVNDQMKLTGIKWIDALNSLVRPLLTIFWCVIFYGAVKVATYWILIHSSMSTAEAIVALFGEFEQGMVGTVMGFWFGDRMYRKMKKS